MRSPSTQAGPSASATEENSEQNNQLDPRFDVADKPSRFFNFGRVFKTLWVEPAGKLPQDGHPAYNTVGYGQFSYAKMRHFVVIRKRLHSCLCLAIHTYGGQGAAKTNIRSQDHAVVYSSLDTEPQPLPDENITIGGFAIVLEEPGETIAPMSRIDFGKVYTIEHNLKILRVGRILPNHLPNLEQAFVGSLLGPALARQAPDPMPQPPQKHNSPSLIYWSDKNVEGYHTLPAEQHHVQDHQFYQLGKVFLVMMHLIDQRDPGRFIFIVLEKGSKSCKCVAIQKNFDPSFAKFSPRCLL
ncbi:hypothetical protein BKA64DRAFT_155812 [Cadophora sp. MPI-SDFR-AT-0126]|nr:hypothetical protein BKA64DRAFT_155812 [Leotiomycetes sp. MPI-SDFR-AT-0126]